MAAAVSRWLGITPASPSDEIDRLIYLDEALENFGFYGNYRQVLRWYEDKKQFGIYPFGNGTWADQPAWLLEHDFPLCEMLEERRDLRQKHAKNIVTKPTPDG